MRKSDAEQRELRHPIEESADYVDSAIVSLDNDSAANNVYVFRSMLALHKSQRSSVLDVLQLLSVSKEINLHCVTNEMGQTELHLDSGEIFLVEHNAVTRLK